MTTMHTKRYHYQTITHAYCSIKWIVGIWERVPSRQYVIAKLICKCVYAPLPVVNISHWKRVVWNSISLFLFKFVLLIYTIDNKKFVCHIIILEWEFIQHTTSKWTRFHSVQLQIHNTLASKRILAFDTKKQNEITTGIVT